MITASQISAATGCSEKGLAMHYASLMQVCDQHAINTPLRFAAFMANCIHETQGFRRLEENLNYSEKGLLGTFRTRFTTEMAQAMAHKPEMIANHVYGGRYGNNKTGDGWKYRGRGILQTTFKDNYKMLSAALKVDFVANPDLLTSPPYAAQSAGFYWHSHKLNTMADAGNMRGVIIAINGWLNGFDERRALNEKLLNALK